MCSEIEIAKQISKLGLCEPDGRAQVMKKTVSSNFNLLVAGFKINKFIIRISVRCGQVKFNN